MGGVRKDRRGREGPKSVVERRLLRHREAWEGSWGPERHGDLSRRTTGRLGTSLSKRDVFDGV